MRFYQVRLSPQNDPGIFRDLSLYTRSHSTSILVTYKGRILFAHEPSYGLFASSFWDLPGDVSPENLRILVRGTDSTDEAFLIADHKSLEHSLFRRDLPHTMFGAIFLILGVFLWGMIVARPKERLAVLSFEAFVLVSAFFCLSSSEIIRVLFPAPGIWNLVSTISFILLPLPILFFCKQVVRKRNDQVLNLFLSVLAVLSLVAIFLLLSRILSPVYLIFLNGFITLIYLLYFSLESLLTPKLSTRIYGSGLLVLATVGMLDFWNYTAGQSFYAGYLSPYGVFLLSVSILAILEYRFMRTQQEMERSNRELIATNASYNRFVPKEFFYFLNKKKITEVRLGDNIEGEFTILVTDIHKFTSMSEEMTPVENFDFVNSYFSRIGPAIKGNSGFIAKYMGDGAMALFPDSPDDALHCACDIHNVMFVYNQSRRLRNRKPVATGIGIHKGVVRLGIIGSESRMQGDLISDTANMAARTEGLTRIYGAATVISEDVYRSLDRPGDFEFRVLDLVLLKGKQEPMRFYEMLEPNPDGSPTLKQLTRERFEEGIHAYLNREFAHAAEIMQEILEKNPGDLAARNYFDNAMFYAINGAPDDWTGVTELHRKS